MNPNDRGPRPNLYSNSLRWTQTYGTGASGWRKRQIINTVLSDLHTQQLDMIDAAVDTSDLSDAKEVIDYIRNKGI